MSPTELEQRVRYLERMSASVRRSQRRDDEDIEKLTIRPRGGSAPAGPVVFSCDGFCTAPQTDILYTITYDWYDFSTDAYISSATYSGTMVYRGREVRVPVFAPTGTTPYWYSVPFQRFPPTAFYAPTFVSQAWTQLLFFCRTQGVARSWAPVICETPTVFGPGSDVTLAGNLVQTVPPATFDYVSPPGLLVPRSSTQATGFSRSCPFDYTYQYTDPKLTDPWGRVVRTLRIYA